MAMNIFSNQITDNGYEKGTIMLRNFYDFILLSTNCNSTEILLKYPEHQKIIDSYWAINFLFIQGIKDNTFNINKVSNHKVKKILWILNNPKLAGFSNKFKNLKIYLQTRSSIFIKAFYKKSNFKFVFSRITSIDWYRRRFFKN